MDEFPEHRCEFDVTGICIYCGRGKKDHPALGFEPGRPIEKGF